MTRQNALRLATGSASAVAIAAVLAACSQPASYATVDLSGSYNSNPVQQAYSPVTGQPLYTANSLYGPQSFPDVQYVPESQYAYQDAPTNQVASLGYNDAGATYPSQGIYETPAYTPPVFNEAPLLSTPQFQTEVMQAAPLGEYQHVGALDAPSPPSIQSQPLGQIEQVYAAPVYESVDEPIVPPAPQSSQIESAPLPQISVNTPHYDLPTVDNDYTTLGGGAARNPYSIINDRGLSPLRNEIAPGFDPDGTFVEEAQDLVPPTAQATRMPTPNAVPRESFALSGAMTVPQASNAYPRPYELLRPGIYPPLEGAGQGMVEAPLVTPMPTMAYVEETVKPEDLPKQERDLASKKTWGEYKIKKGDTLYSIARRVGSSVDDLTERNELKSAKTIYAGQKIEIPVDVRAEVEKIGDEEIPMVDVAEAATAYEYEYDFDDSVAEFENPFGSDTAQALVKKLIAMERATIPTTDKVEAVMSKRFAWPVHGEVYKLDAGQIEIDPAGNDVVRATAAGKVVHVEKGPLGVLVVIEHENGWRSLTVGLDESRVSVGDEILQGKRIGIASREHRVRFELRDAASEVADALEQLNG